MTLFQTFDKFATIISKVWMLQTIQIVFCASKRYFWQNITLEISHTAHISQIWA